MARELHDTVTQTLFSANLIAEVIPKLWEKNPEAVIERLEEVRKLNNVALTEMRVLLYELKPSAIRDEDLGNLLHGMVKFIGARSKIPIELITNGEYKFSPKIVLGCYRIAQEALNNIIKHSHATKATLVLKIFPDKLYMDITDNGCGFDNKKIALTNLGLTIMRERAKLIGASIFIDSLPGKGTKITVIYNKKQQINRNNIS
ncbi:MAG: sensor histidine kinase [Actinobacteria bacterium]|nr:sensor histidine kinase [Actinomycetota bacterium]